MREREKNCDEFAFNIEIGLVTEVTINKVNKMHSNRTIFLFKSKTTAIYQIYYFIAYYKYYNILINKNKKNYKKIFYGYSYEYVYL